MSRRRRGALLIGLALALGGLAASDVGRREAAVRAQLAPLVDVVVAGRDLPPGRRVRPADLALRRIPARYAPVGAASVPEEVVGRRPAAGVPRGAYLGPGELEDEAAARPPSIRRGERAVEVAGTGSAELVVAGARVDVVVVPERGGARLALTGADVLSARPLAAADGGGRGAGRRDAARDRPPGARARLARGRRARGAAARADELAWQSRGASPARPQPPRAHEEATHRAPPHRRDARRRAEPRPRGLLRPRRLRRPRRRPRSRSRRRPADGWFLEQGAFRRARTARRGAAASGSSPTGRRDPTSSGSTPRPHTTISRLVLTYRAHLSGADGVGGADVRGARRATPAVGSPSAPRAATSARVRSTSAATGGRRRHGADALRIGTRCELRGPCVDGGQPAARFHALAVVLRDDRAPRAAIAAPGGHVRGDARPAGARDGRRRRRVRADPVRGRAHAGRRRALRDGARLGRARCATSSAGVPCPLDAPARVRVDTRTLVDGRHVLRARVEDVAGNVRTAEAAIVVDNRPPQRRHRRARGRGRGLQALTAVPEGFAGQDVAYAYRWQRCDAGG